MKAPPPSAASRLWQLDLMRGVSIALVVFVHAYFGPPGWAQPSETYPMRALYFLGHTVVPVFFMVSGYLFAREAALPARAVLLRKARYILVPAVVWSLVALAIHEATSSQSTAAALRDLLLFNAGGQYFYVLVLCILFAAALPLRTAPIRVLDWLAVVLATLGLFRAIAVELSPPTTTLGWILTYRDPALWAAFFVVGLRAGRHPFSLPRPVVAASLAAMLLLMAAWFAEGAAFGYAESYFSPFVYLFGLLLAWLLANRAARPVGAAPLVLRPLITLGRHYFAIYLVHVPLFIGLVTDWWLPEVGLDSYTRRVLFRFAVGLGGPILLAALVWLLIPRPLARAIGFEARRGPWLPLPRRSAAAGQVQPALAASARLRGQPAYRTPASRSPGNSKP